MHTLNYNPTDLPFNIQKSVSSWLHQIVNKVNHDLNKVASSKTAGGGTLRTPPGSRASRVKVGFKAPVSMTLLPYFVHLYPKVMFLHVLRDGRDIAFSSNLVSIILSCWCVISCVS